MSWYQDWFDSPLYEALYASRDEMEAQKLAKLIERLYPRSDYPTIIDLACGRGRHSLNLAALGYTVTGVDLAPSAIQKAQHLAVERNLDNRTSFKVGDMRVPLDLQAHVLVNLFTSFGYFENDLENVQVLQAMNKMLLSKGVLIIDYLNAPKVIANLILENSGKVNNLDYTISRWIQQDIVYKKITFTDKRKDTTFTEQVKLYDLNWFKDALTSAGFHLKKVYGDYSGEEYDESSSNRLILLAQKIE